MEIKFKKILILGGAGFIGNEIARILSDSPETEVTIVDNLSRGKLDYHFKLLINDTNRKINFLSLDLTQSKSYEKLDKDYNHVYVLASVVGVSYTTEIPDRLLFINTSIILNTCEWLKTAKIKKVLFTSTSENYVGAIEEYNYKVPTDEKVPVTITDITNSRFTYAATKILGESFFINYSKVWGFDSIIVRYHNVYGPRMGFKHVIPQVIQRVLAKEKPLKIYNGSHTRAFNFIKDAALGTILAMENGCNGNIYHIGDPKSEISIEELTKYIANYLKYDGEFLNISDDNGSVSRRAPDITKAEKELSYNPKINWKDGVEKTIDWYVDHLKENKPFE
jgi:UDP-glucose 4-epimerase